MKFLLRFIDDLMVLAGCGCILYGLSLWNPVITWIAAGIMLASLGVVIGKIKAKG